MGKKVRIDKYLHAVRIFKTRSLATETCNKGKVLINNYPVKASRMISIGEVVEIKFPPIVRTFKVLDLLEKRTSAKFVDKYLKETTPETEFEKLKIAKTPDFIHRDKGSGRPTKKDRRIIDNLKNQNL